MPPLPPPTGPAHAGLVLHTCAPAARACAPAPHRRPGPAPRSRRGPAAPDSRRQGPSPSRPKAGGKRSRGKPPPPSPAALPASPRPPAWGGRRRPPAPRAPAQPRPEARRGAGRTRQLWQRERRNHGGGRRAAPGRDPVPVAPGLAGPPEPGPGVRAPQLGGTWGAARAARGAHSLTGVEGGGGHVRGQVRFVRHPPERRGARGAAGPGPRGGGGGGEARRRRGGPGVRAPVRAPAELPRTFCC